MPFVRRHSARVVEWHRMSSNIGVSYICNELDADFAAIAADATTKALAFDASRLTCVATFVSHIFSHLIDSFDIRFREPGGAKISSPDDLRRILLSMQI